MIPAEACLVRIHVNANDRWHGRPLYEAVVTTARALHLAGASVFPVELSFGAHHRLRDASSDYLFTEIPVVIEVVDAPDHIAALLSELGSMIGEGFVTVESVRVLRSGQPTDTPRMSTTSPTGGSDPPAGQPGRISRDPLTGS